MSKNNVLPDYMDFIQASRDYYENWPIYKRTIFNVGCLVWFRVIMHMAINLTQKWN